MSIELTERLIIWSQEEIISTSLPEGKEGDSTLKFVQDQFGSEFSRPGDFDLQIQRTQSC